MVAKESKKEKRAKHPKGFAQIPEWWMEITPHDTLDVDEDAAKRMSASKEAQMYADLAAKSDREQAGSAKLNGAFLDTKSKLKASSPSSGGGVGYGHQDMNWKKPEWMKTKLKTTDAGAAMRKGTTLEKKL